MTHGLGERRVAEQSDGSNPPQRSAGTEVPAPWLSMASWIAGLRDGDTAAVRAFYTTYAALLRDQARRMGVPAEERDELVTTVLGDVLLHLQETDLLPRDLARYVVGSLRNRARNGHRDRERRDARLERAYSHQVYGGQRVVAECHSEYGIRSAGAADEGDDGKLSRAIAKLAAFSAQALGPDDAALMVGLSHHVPLRDLAAHAGISYGAARVRVHRLRERFRKLLPRFVSTLDAGERAEMERFLRRAGVVLHAEELAARSPAPRRGPTTAARDGGDPDQ